MRRAWLVASALCIATGAHAGSPIDAPAFTAAPADLLAAAPAAPPGEIALLLRDRAIDLEPDHETTRTHYIAIARSSAAADQIAPDETYVPPEAAPVIRVRVIDPDGHATELAPSAISDTIDSRDASGSTRRVLGHFASLRPGSVIETLTTRTRTRTLHAGIDGGFALDGTLPAATTRAAFSAPTGSHVRFAEQGLPRGAAAHHTVENHRDVWRYELGAHPAVASEPGDAGEGMGPIIMYSTIPSWNALARELHASLEARGAAGAPAWPAGIAKTPTIETARAIIAWVRAHAPAATGRYFVYESSFPPAAPADVIAHGGGDALSVAGLAAALLRQASLHADVALVAMAPQAIRNALPGTFGVALALVRIKLGAAEVWIDPNELHLPVGQLMPDARGRDALILADGTTALTATPPNRIGDSTVHEVRTYELAEEGPPRVTVTYQVTGPFAANSRDVLARQAPDATKTELAQFADWTFGGTIASVTEGSLDDVDRPLERTLIIANARRALAIGDAISIELTPGAVLADVPDVLRSGARRAHPYHFPTVTHEVETRVVIPDGFKLPNPDPDRATSLGALHLTEHQALDGRTLVITDRLEPTALVLTPAEVEATRAAVTALAQQPNPVLKIWSTVHVAMQREDYAAAIAEATRMIQLHPTEALHHEMFADLGIQLGDGLLARREATLATQAEPRRARAWGTLGWTLAHDPAGRDFGFDADRAGAIAAFRRAHALAPDDRLAMEQLAFTLERDSHGARIAGPELREALALRRTLAAAAPSVEHTVAVASDLLWSGDRAGAEAALTATEHSDGRDGTLVAAIALGSGGVDAALRGADALASGADHTKLLVSAAWLAAGLREYHVARRLLAPVDGDAEAQLLEQLLLHATRFDQPFALGRDASSVAVEVGLEALHRDRPHVAFWDEDTATDYLLKTSAAEEMRDSGVPTAMLDDVVRGMVVGVAGAAPVWRVETVVGSRSEILYLASNRGQPKLLGTSAMAAAIGRHVLRLLAGDDDAAAAQLLDWIARDQPKSSIAAIWAAKQPRDHAQMLIAGALLAGATDPATVLPIATACASSASVTATRGRCDGAAIAVLHVEQRWSDILARIPELEARWPDNGFVLVAHLAALRNLGRLDEAEALIRGAPAPLAAMHGVVLEHAVLEAQRGDAKTAHALIEGAMREPNATAPQLNGAAWSGIFLGADLSAIDAAARRAVQLDPTSGPALNTLAVAEVEEGQLHQGLADALRAARLAHRMLTVDDRYAIGRYYEQLGLRDDAITIYRGIVAERKPDPGHGDTGAELAAARLAALGVK